MQQTLGQFGGDVFGLASQILLIRGMAEALMKLVGEVNWASGEGKSFVETYDQVFRSVAELDEKQDSRMLVEILTRVQA